MLKVEGLSFAYDKKTILSQISFEADLSQVLAVIGKSGSGKSTLLKLLYGEYDLDQGHIYWKNKKILGPSYNLVVGYDFMKYVAQDSDLEPYTAVQENIGKFLSNFYPEKKAQRTEELLEVVELKHLKNQKVKTLSGGQKQRVALAQALAKTPEIILLDEPFSHIDNFKKQSLRRNVFRYLKTHQITCVLATHDKSDVLGYADDMIVLQDQKIIAQNTPQHLFENPKTPLVASFFDEFNIINDAIVYAHELKIVSKSASKAIVKQSYYQGRYWLIEAFYNDSTIFLNHTKSLPENAQIFFKINKKR